MQLNLGKFSVNGGCGYVRKPSCMLRPKTFDPFTRVSIEEVVPIALTVKVLGACIHGGIACVTGLTKRGMQ